MQLSDPEFLFERDVPLAFVTFNRPASYNAMTWAMYDGLVDACEKVDADADLRVLILRGAGGKAFVAGAGISQFHAFCTPHDALVEERRLGRGMCPAEAGAKPTTSALEGS